MSHPFWSPPPPPRTLLLQDVIKQKFMGSAFWENKLRKYMEVKQGLLHATDSTESIQAKKEKIRRAKEARRERIAKRKKEARDATSAFKRNLLLALNYADAMMM